MIRASLLVAIMAALTVGASAFQTTKVPANTCRSSTRTITSPTLTLLRESKAGAGDADAASKGETAAPVTVESFITEKYPEFKALLTKNETLWKLIQEAQTAGCTIFCPTSAAFADLGEKRLKQLTDERNEETAQRIGSYHVILSDAVPANQLFIEDWTGPKPEPGTQRPIKVGGINTVGGGVPISREKTGGFMGWGAKEDGVAVIGSDNAKILRSLKIGKSIIHETDAFISPQLLWRYLDQLRIPGF
jgi:uncharacterized surface protein with fasciclin (FAS1) repeats